MMHSMTGFGEAQLEQDDWVYHVELRSFNQRYLKTTVHLPDDFAFLEPEVERVLRERLTRGSVTLRLHARNLSRQAALDLNTAAIEAYVDQLQRAVGDRSHVTIDLATIMTLPGVCLPRELTESEREQRWTVLHKLTNTALERLIEMREAEGEALAADLRTHCEAIRKSLSVVKSRVPNVVAEYRDRLRNRVQELIADHSVRLAEDDLLKEVSIYAERSDISEELSRLIGHLDQFEQFMQSSEPAGRKLEFVSQEMLREANTMGAKTGDPTISREIIEIKSAVDRIKEQVQNAE